MLLSIVLFLGIILWKGASRFNGGGRGVGVAFQMGRGFTFKWEVCPMGGIGFDGGRLKKSQDGGAPLPCLPHYGKPFPLYWFFMDP